MMNNVETGSVSLEAMVARAEAMYSLLGKLEAERSVTMDGVAAVESFCPNGKTMDTFFSSAPAAQKHRAALEELSKGIIALIATAVLAVIATIMKIYKFFTTGSSSGSGSGGNTIDIKNVDDDGHIVKPEQAIERVVEKIDPQAKDFQTLGQMATPLSNHPADEGVQGDVLKRIETLALSIASRSPTSMKRTNCITAAHASRTVIGEILLGKDIYYSLYFKESQKTGIVPATGDVQKLVAYFDYWIKFLKKADADLREYKNLDAEVAELHRETARVLNLHDGQTLKGVLADIDMLIKDSKMNADLKRGPVSSQDDVRNFILRGPGGVVSAPARFLRQFRIADIQSSFIAMEKHVKPLLKLVSTLKTYQQAYEEFVTNESEDGMHTVRPTVRGLNLTEPMIAVQYISKELSVYVYAYNVYVEEVSSFLQTYHELCKIALLHPEEFIKSTDMDAAKKLIDDLRDSMKVTHKLINEFSSLPKLTMS